MKLPHNEIQLDFIFLCTSFAALLRVWHSNLLGAEPGHAKPPPPPPGIGPAKPDMSVPLFWGPIGCWAFLVVGPAAPVLSDGTREWHTVGTRNC